MGLFKFFGKMSRRPEEPSFNIENIYRQKIKIQQTMLNSSKPEGRFLLFGDTTVENKNYLLMYEQSEYSAFVEPNLGQEEKLLKAYQYGAISVFDLQNGKQILKAEFRKERDAKATTWESEKEVGFNLVTKKGKRNIKAYSAKDGWQLFDGQDLYTYDKADKKVFKLSPQIVDKFRRFVFENSQAHELYLAAQKLIAARNRQQKSVEQGR